jgi:hypothetical protein
VSALVGQYKQRNMAVRLLIERLVWEDIGHLVEKGLMIGVSTSKSEHSDARLIEEDFTADQSVGPSPIDGPGATEEVNTTVFVSPSEVDDLTGYWAFEVQVPRLREWSAGRSSLDAIGLLGAACVDEPIRASGQGDESLMMKAVPHEALPSSVVAFDSGLEARLCRRDEDRYNAQLETYADNSSDRVAVMMGTLESCVVIELAIAGQTDLSPMIEYTILRPNGRERASLRPGSHKASMERDGVENIDQRAVLDAEVLDDVESVDFGTTVSHLGKVPSEGWGRPSQTAYSIESSTAFEDASNGPEGRNWVESGLAQFPVDGESSVFTEVAVNLQGPSQVEDAVFQMHRGSVDRAVGTWGVGSEIDAVQTLGTRASQPMLNGGQTDTKLSGDSPHGATSSHGVNDASASQFDGLFWVIGRSPMARLFGNRITSQRSPYDLRVLTLG